MDDIAMESHGMEQQEASAAAFPSSAAATASPPRAKRVVLRVRLSPAWTPEEDAFLARLAAENGFRHWRRVAGDMSPYAAASVRRGRRSPRQCRDRWRDHLALDVYHRPFTADDDAELASLVLRPDGDGRERSSWKDISKGAYCRSSRDMRRRWRELRDSDAFLKKLWCPLPPPVQQSS